MIESKYLDNVSIPSFDSAINDLLAVVADGGGNDMVIAVENLDGKIYRVITTSGLVAYMDVVTGLTDLGFDDKLADSVSGKKGYDSWFVVTHAVRTSKYKK